MYQPSQSDTRALEDVGPLLRFAAERVKNLDPDLSLAIAEARAAVNENQWTPQVAQRFWTAFGKLCDLIHPTTMASLAAVNANIDSRWPLFWRVRKVSLAERTSRRYLSALVILLAVILPIQLYAWTCSNLSKNVTDIIAADKSKFSQLFEEFTRFVVATKDKGASGSEMELAKIYGDAKTLNGDIDTIVFELNDLERVSSLFHAPRRETPVYQSIDGPQDMENLRKRFNKVQVSAQVFQEGINLRVGILVSFFLPILFGTSGAIAYVIRAISDQISQTTFSPTSPMRHIMRVSLGDLLAPSLDFLAT
jgi:hypothetical protein